MWTASTNGLGKALGACGIQTTHKIQYVYAGTKAFDAKLQRQQNVATGTSNISTRMGAPRVIDFCGSRVSDKSHTTVQ